MFADPTCRVEPSARMVRIARLAWLSAMSKLMPVSAQLDLSQVPDEA